MKVLTQKNIMIVFLAVMLAYKVVCIDDRFNKSIVVFRGENAAYEFIKAILKNISTTRK